MSHKKHAGFTLVELLVVIAIIGILSTIAVVALNGARRKARDVKRVENIRQLHLSLELYNNESNGYPSEDTPVTLGTGTYSSLCAGGFKTVCSGGEQVFMGIIPSAPAPTDGSCSDGDNDFSYQTPGGGEYEITYCLGEKVGAITAGIHTATPSGIQ